MILLARASACSACYGVHIKAVEQSTAVAAAAGVCQHVSASAFSSNIDNSSVQVKDGQQTAFQAEQTAAQHPSVMMTICTTTLQLQAHHQQQPGPAQLIRHTEQREQSILQGAMPC